MLDMQIVRDINALYEFRKHLYEKYKFYVDNNTHTINYIEVECINKRLEKEEHERLNAEVEANSKIIKETKTMLDAIDKEIESNIVKLKF